MSPFAATMALAFAFPQALAQSADRTADTEVVATHTDRGDRLTVPVHVGDHGPFAFLIDTGSENTVVSSTLSARLALSPGKPSKVIGIAGAMAVDTVEIDEITLGRRSYYGLVAPVLERANIGAEGILGLDSLQNQRVLIDFRRNLMAVNDARALGGDSGFEIVVTARRRSGQLIMTNAVIDGVRVDVMIDTGSDTTLGNRALQRMLGKRNGIAWKSMLYSVTGQKLPADMGYARKLELQGVTLTNVLLAFSDSPTFAYLKLDKKPALFLGIRELRVFPRVAIDFKARKVLLDLPNDGEPRYFAPPSTETPLPPR